MYTNEIKTTLVKLFHVLPDFDTVDENNCVFPSELYKYGIVVPDAISKSDADILVKTLGVNQDDWNQTFHKSFEKVATAPIEQLVIEQVIHYFSTYGFESLGLTAMPVIPREEVLSDPDALPNVKAFTVVKLVNDSDTMRDLVSNYFTKTLAPNRNLVYELLTLAKFFNLKDNEIASFELKLAYWEEYNIIPTDGRDFLRYMVYMTTGSTLLINSARTANSIKRAILYSYDKKFEGKEVELSKIFFNYKKIILAFKSTGPIATRTINRARRLADKNHIKANPNRLANVSQLAKQDEWGSVEEVLTNTSTRNLVKLYNFAAGKQSACQDEVYTIRTGASYVTTKEDKDVQTALQLKMVVMNVLSERFHDKFEGKTFYIPSYISYAVPTSEKQFIGNIPFATSLNVEAPTVGIYWTDYQNRRTDIDLHLSSPTKSYGWNAFYRSDSKKILYSGDMTSAVNGAAEAFYFGDNDKENFILTVNNYTGKPDVPFQFIVTDKFGYGEYGKTSPITVEDALFPPIPLKFADKADMSIGVFGQNNKFYFYSGDLSGNRIPDRSLRKNFLAGILNKVENQLTMTTLLTIGGATVIKELPEDADKEIISLAPQSLTARTLLDLVEVGDGE